jgi:hypothetical protein
MSTKLQRNSRFFSIASLLLIVSFATVLSKRHALGNLEGTLPQTHPLSAGVRHTGSLASHPKPDQNLLFDPVLAYSTYLGGASSANYPLNSMLQVASVILTDAAGNLYVAGSTNSRSFPITPSVVEPNNPQKNLLGFLAKLDPTGQSLIFSTYIDGLSGVSQIAQPAARKPLLSQERVSLTISVLCINPTPAPLLLLCSQGASLSLSFRLAELA